MRHCSGIVRAAAVAAMLIADIDAMAANVTVVGLFPRKAVVVINGAAPRTISVGQKQVEGVTLLSTASSSALFDVDGTKHNLELGEHFAAPANSAGASANDTLVISADTVGHFWTLGQINGNSVRFLVDTGATSIAIPASAAKNMGINYKKGNPGFVTTAGGVVPAWRVTLDAVTIGTITLYRVDASVLEGGLDTTLLGMSFLSRMEMKHSGAQMVLRKRF